MKNKTLLIIFISLFTIFLTFPVIADESSVPIIEEVPEVNEETPTVETTPQEEISPETVIWDD